MCAIALQLLHPCQLGHWGGKAFKVFSCNKMSQESRAHGADEERGNDLFLVNVHIGKSEPEHACSSTFKH